MGIMLNQLFPDILVVMCLALTLGFTSYKTLQKGVKLYKQEAGRGQYTAMVKPIDTDQPEESEEVRQLMSEVRDVMLSLTCQNVEFGYLGISCPVASGSNASVCAFVHAVPRHDPRWLQNLLVSHWLVDSSPMRLSGILAHIRCHECFARRCSFGLCYSWSSSPPP